MGCLKIIRWILAIILSVILFVVIVGGLPLAGFAQLVVVKENLKGWIKDGGVYNNLDDAMVDVVLDRVDEEQVDFLQFTTEDQLKEIAGGIFSPTWLETNFGKVIDAVYVWLNGEAEKPTFEVELTNEQQTLQDAIVDIYKQYLEGLPTCEDSDQVNADNFDPFKVECLPPDVSVDDADEMMKGSLPSEIFEKSSISSEEIFKDTVISTEVTKKAQQIFSIFKKLSLIIIIVILVLSLILFVLIPGFKNGFMFTGLAWVISSSSLLFFGSYSKRNFDQVFDAQVRNISSEQADIVISVVKEPLRLAYFDLLAEASKLAMVIVVLGVILVFGGVVLKLSRRRYYVKEEDLGDDDIEDLEEAVNLPTDKRIGTVAPTKSEESKADAKEGAKTSESTREIPTSPLAKNKK